MLYFLSVPEIQPKLFQPLSYKLRGSDVEIYWDPVPLREQPACIHGYVLYYFKNRGEPISVTTGNAQLRLQVHSELLINLKADFKPGL